MDQFDDNPGLQGARRELPMRIPENPSSLGFESPGVPVDNMYQENWGMNEIPTPFLEPITKAAFDMDTWNMFPEIRQATNLPSHLALLGSEGPLTTPQSARVPVDPIIDFNSFGNMTAQMSQQQMPYTDDVYLGYNLGTTSPQLMGPSGHIPSANICTFCLNENTGWFINVPNLMMVANPPSAWVAPSWYGDAIAARGEKNSSGVPARNGLNITTSSLRIRGVRSPPQKYEGDVGRLYDRLINEGADISAAKSLRDVVFANGVTYDALTAPIQTCEVVGVRDGANRMWKMLLKTKEGEEKSCCLLCPVGKRREFRHGHDAVRHFNRDHFGFSFPCEYWWVYFLRSHLGRVLDENRLKHCSASEHQFFRDAERKIHAKKCEQRPQ